MLFFFALLQDVEHLAAFLSGAGKHCCCGKAKDGRPSSVIFILYVHIKY